MPATNFPYLILTNEFLKMESNELECKNIEIWDMNIKIVYIKKRNREKQKNS